MKEFSVMEVKEALEYAEQGGQALHLHKIIVDCNKAPKCFVNAVNRGEFIAHLFDQDIKRLIRTAKILGVNVILVEREGTISQHIDLCGKPLKKARELCQKDEQRKLF